ncbi:hypothetical protein [Moraxella lacunata]
MVISSSLPVIFKNHGANLITNLINKQLILSQTAIINSDFNQFFTKFS